MYVKTSSNLTFFIHTIPLFSPAHLFSNDHMTTPAVLCRAVRTVQRPRMGQNLSSNWLQRCKPDLSTLEETCKAHSSGRGGGMGQSLTDGGEQGKEVEETVEEVEEEEREEEMEEVEEDEEEEEEEKEEEEEEEEVEVEDDEREVKKTGEENKEYDEEEEEEEEDEEEGHGWDGRLQDSPEADEHLSYSSMRQRFFPTAKHHITAEIGGGSGTNITSSFIASTKTKSLFIARKEVNLKEKNAEQVSNCAEAFNGTLVSLSVNEVNLQQVTNDTEETSFHTQRGSSNSSTLSILEGENQPSVHTARTGRLLASVKKWQLKETKDKGAKGGTLLEHAEPSTNIPGPSKRGRDSRKRQARDLNVKPSVRPQDLEQVPSEVDQGGDGPAKKQKPARLDSDSNPCGKKGGSEGGSAPSATSSSFSSNAVSNNFVRLNLKVKRFSRKPAGLSGSAYKRRMWKKNQKGESGSWYGGGGGWGASKGSSGTCFKCGKPGHWAKNCLERVGSKNLGSFAGEKVSFSDNLESMEELDSDTLQQLARESPFPSTREAALMARGVRLEQSRQALAAGTEDPQQPEELFVPLPPCNVPPPPPPPSAEPFFPSDPGRASGTVNYTQLCMLHMHHKPHCKHKLKWSIL